MQQRLGDGQDALAAELLAVAEPQLLDLVGERTFSHDQRVPCEAILVWMNGRVSAADRLRTGVPMLAASTGRETR